MDTCIQEYAMPKKERDYDNTVLSLRFTSMEAARFWRVMDQVKARNAYAGKSDVYRELLGLKSPDLLTEEEITFFRTGEKHSSSAGVTVATRSKSAGIPLITPKTTERRKVDAPQHKKKNKRVA